MYEELILTKIVRTLRQQYRQFPDERTENNCPSEEAGAGMRAFSVFFTQSPSFLAYQRGMQLHKGKSNAERLFEPEELPSDNQICNLRDPLCHFEQPI